VSHFKAEDLKAFTWFYYSLLSLPREEHVPDKDFSYSVGPKPKLVTPFHYL
jgi:hypothetical protein